MQSGVKSTSNSATPVANGWNQFLLGGLQNGTFGAPAGPNNINTPSPTIFNKNATTPVSGANANNQAGGLADAINQMLSGKNPLAGNGGANLPTTPGFQGTNFNQLGNVDLSQFNASGQNGVMSGLPTGFNNHPAMAGGGTATYDPGHIADFLNTNTQNYNYTPGQVQNPLDNPVFQALTQQQGRQSQADVANLRARFGGSLGSGAQYAEGNYLAQANPANMLAQNQLAMQMQGVDQNQQQINNQMRLGLLGGQSNDILGRLGLTNQSQLGNAGNAANVSIANAGNNTQASIANANLQNSSQQQLMNYLLGRGQLDLSVRGQDAGNMLNQFNANNSAMQTNNSNMFNNNQAMNSFNTNMFNQQSSNALQNQGLMNNYGVQGAQMGQQNMMNMLNQLFASYGQANQIGLPQAQTVVTPSPFSQVMGGLGAIGQAAGGIGTLANAVK